MPACVGNQMTGGCEGTPRNRSNLIEYNRVSANGDNGISFALRGPADVVMLPWANVARYNTSNGNTGSGVAVDPNSRYNLVLGNTANSNQESGINVARGALSNRITGNRASANVIFDGSDGNMDDPATPGTNEDCDANTWSGNTFGSGLTPGKVNQPCVRGHTP